MLIARRVLIGIIAVAALDAATFPRAEAGTIPLQEAWESLDAPQTHGPGGVVVEHLPLNSGGLTSDSLVVDFPNSQFVADDFMVPASVIIGRVSWHGFYDLNIEPTLGETFRLQVHLPRASDGLPGEVIFTQEFANPARQWTGRLILDSGAPKEYRYEVDLAGGVSLVASQLYWLEIAGIGDINSAFRWEVSDTIPLTGLAFVNPIVGDWVHTQSITANNAFELSTAPEPTTGGLFCLIGLGLVCRRGSRTIMKKSAFAGR